MVSIRLQDAYLCSECDQIVPNANCCVCGCKHGLLSLSAALNRESITVPTESFGRLAAAVGQLEAVLATQ
jgi:hypothetical protein